MSIYYLLLIQHSNRFIIFMYQKALISAWNSECYGIKADKCDHGKGELRNAGASCPSYTKVLVHLYCYYAIIILCAFLDISIIH